MGVIWCVVWYWWYRGKPTEKARVTQVEIKEIGVQSFADNHYLPWSMALRSTNLWAILSLVFGYVFALYFFTSWLRTFPVKARGFSEGDLLPPALRRFSARLGM